MEEQTLNYSCLDLFTIKFHSNLKKSTNLEDRQRILDKLSFFPLFFFLQLDGTHFSNSVGHLGIINSFPSDNKEKLPPCHLIIREQILKG